MTSTNWLVDLLVALQKIGPFALQNSLDNEIAHPMDSHPTTRERIAALTVPLDSELLARALRPVAAGDNAFSVVYSPMRMC